MTRRCMQLCDESEVINLDELDHLVKRIGWYTKKVKESAKWPREKRERRHPKLLAYKERLHDLIRKRKPSAHMAAEGESGK
ncbi:hypothetical protein ABE237_15670 [Brevibacillus formosus]|uniref:hypothetical protein n=1 Tax=Brevibacillus formosus TaxID=54913 RepID=UPI001F5508F0|nr:hypothetical protein [Brevibacillus formosus]